MPPPPALDRTAFSVVSLAEHDAEERAFWRAKTPHERLEGVETTRRLLYGPGPTSARLQRVLEVARLTRR